MPRPARVSPDHILAVAAREFAERGFAGARVDRIASRAGVNKAMLYYHFKSKQRLYRTLLRRMFSAAAERLRAIATSSDPPPKKLDAAIAGMAALIAEHSPFAAIMLREVAEGGAHLDRETLRTLAAVPQAFAAIVREGVDARAFRPVHPAFAYFSMLAPIVFFLAGTPIRTEIAHLHLMDLGGASAADFVAYMQGAVRRSLAVDAPAPERQS